MSALWTWWAMAHAAPLELVWTVETGPLAAPGLTVGPEGLAVRTEAGWESLGASGRAAVDTTRLGWWDQVGADGRVVFGQMTLVLLDGGAARWVGATPTEQRLDGVVDAWVGDGTLVGLQPGRGWVARRGDETLWELAGDYAVRALGDRIGRVVERGLEVVEPSTGRLVDVVALGDAPVGGLASFAGCVVVLPAAAGYPVTCRGSAGVVWEAPLAGAVFDRDPIGGDLDGDGRDELVAVSTSGRAFVLDARGHLVANGPVGTGAAVVADGLLVAGDGPACRHGALERPWQR